MDKAQEEINMLTRQNKRLTQESNLQLVKIKVLEANRSSIGKRADTKDPVALEKMQKAMAIFLKTKRMGY